MMEFLLQNPLLLAGIVGFAFFLLAGLITAGVLKNKRKRIEKAVCQEYEQAGGDFAG